MIVLLFSPILASAYQFAVNPTVETEIVTPIVGGDSLETIKVLASPGSAVTIIEYAQNVAEEGYDYNVKTTLRIIDPEGKIYYSNIDPLPENILRISVFSGRIDSEMKPRTVTTKPSHLETEEWDGPLQASALLYSGEAMLTRVKVVFSYDMPSGTYRFEILYQHEDPRNSPIYESIIEEAILTVSVSPDTPISRNIAVGGQRSSVPFSKITLVPINEDILLQALTINMEAGTNEVADFESIHLYNNGVEISSIGWLTGNNKDNPVNHTFYIADLIILKDEGATLTVQGNLNTLDTGATSGHSPRFYFADVTGATDLVSTNIKAIGLTSGSIVKSLPGSVSPEIPTNFGEMTLVKTKPTFTFLEQKGWAGILFPSLSQRVLDFTITADNAGDIIFDGSTDSITFKVSGYQSENDLTTDTITVYRSDTGAAVGTTSAPNSLDVGDTVSVTITDEIPAGTIRSYYVECSLNDYETNDDRFKLSITETVWSDGTVEGANISNSLTDGLPIEGYTLVNP